MTESKSPELPIRSIGRGLEVLRLVSLDGPLNLAEIKRASALPYPTVSRIVSTLMSDGYLEREPDRKRYRVTEKVQSLAHGFQNDSRLVRVARTHLIELTGSLDWPVLIATRLGRSMIVRDSTHTLTSLTLNHYFPGYTFPIIDSAAGRAYLAFCSPEEREVCLTGLEATGGDEVSHAIQLARDGKELEEIRKNGFATRDRNSFTQPPGKNSSIAAPIFDGSEICGALALVYFAAAMSMDEAIERYAKTIMAKAKDIGNEMALSGPAQAD